MNIIEMRYDIKIAMHGLLIIDMQKAFSASRDPELQQTIRGLIRWSMYHGCPIVFEEYFPKVRNSLFQGTHKSLKQLVLNEGYDRYATVEKDSDDGSLEAEQAFKRYPIKQLLVTGVDADCCVLKTVTGIARKMPNMPVSVIRNACGNSATDTQLDDNFWNSFSLLGGNVSVCDAVTHPSQRRALLCP